MLAIKYITILYTALLIITFVLIMNKCGGRCLGKCCRITTIKASVVHGISSFLRIGYSQCVNVSLRLLLQVHVYASRDDSFRPPSRVWFKWRDSSLQQRPSTLCSTGSILFTDSWSPSSLTTFDLSSTK